MTTRLFLLALALLIALGTIITACVSAAPTADPRVQAAAANEADRLNAIAATQERQSQNATFEYEQTATALPFAVTALAQERELAQIYVDGKAADAVATQTYRVTESAYSAIIIPTKIAAVGTELARGAEIQEADVKTAKSRRDMWAGAPLAALVAFIMLAWWVAGLIQAHHKKKNNIAEAKPYPVGDMMFLPDGRGGWTAHRIVHQSHPALPAPVEIEERPVPVNSNGKPGFITISQPVNEHEKIWRITLGDSALIFEKHGFSSADLCGKGRPFASASHWKVVTDVLADNGLILKEHGQTTLVAGQWGDVITRIQDATHPLKLPAYLPPHLRPFQLQNMN